MLVTPEGLTPPPTENPGSAPGNSSDDNEDIDDNAVNTRTTVVSSHRSERKKHIITPGD